MKLAITLMLLFHATFLLSQGNNCDSIHWTKSAKLSWSDFKAVPDTTVDAGATSSLGIAYILKRTNDSVSIKTVCYFKPCLSWCKFKNSDTLLIHEQGHFNIAEYFRRLFIKRVFEYRFHDENVVDIVEKNLCC